MLNILCRGAAGQCRDERCKHPPFPGFDRDARPPAPPLSSTHSSFSVPFADAIRRGGAKTLRISTRRLDDSLPTMHSVSVLVYSVSAGGPLRRDMMRAVPVVSQNQTVKLISEGRGFSISTDGKALNNAAEGQVVQVRIVSGQVVGGIARAGGIVNVSY